MWLTGSDCPSLHTLYVDWTVRDNVRAQLRVLVKRILRKHGYPPDKAEKATQTVLEQAEVLSAGWAGCDMAFHACSFSPFTPETRADRGAALEYCALNSAGHRDETFRGLPLLAV